MTQQQNFCTHGRDRSIEFHSQSFIQLNVCEDSPFFVCVCICVCVCVCVCVISLSFSHQIFQTTQKVSDFIYVFKEAKWYLLGVINIYLSQTVLDLSSQILQVFAV